MQSTDGIRAAVMAVSREVALLEERRLEGDGKRHEALRSAWMTLVDALALGPAPEYRTCPHCGATGMRAATRCGSCWRALVPPPSDAARASVAT
jgi:hypothetical protein